MSQNDKQIISTLKSSLNNAIRKGDIDSLKILLTSTDNINISLNANHDTPLSLASRLGRKDMVVYLIGHGADIHAHGQNERTAIDWALANNHYDIALLLKDYGAQINEQAINKLKSKLNVAIKNEKIEDIKYIFKLGIDVNARINELNDTPLTLASRLGKGTVVDFFIYENADLNARGAQNLTAIELAINNSHAKITQLLNTHSMGINARDADDNTALDRALHEGKYDKARFLLQNGANINIKDADGNTPLGRTLEKGMYDSAKFLIQNGAYIDYNAIEEFRYRFSKDVRDGHFSKVSRLAAVGFNELHFRDKNNHSSFMYAVLNNNANEFLDAIRKSVNTNDKRTMMSDLIELRLMIEEKEYCSPTQRKQYISHIEKAYNELQANLMPNKTAIIDIKHPIGRVFATENFRIIARNLEKNINSSKEQSLNTIDIQPQIEKLSFKVAVGMAKVGKALEERNKTKSLTLKVQDFFNKLSNVLSALTGSYVSNNSIGKLANEMEKEFGIQAKKGQINTGKNKLKNIQESANRINDKLSRIADTLSNRNPGLKR